MSKNPTFRFYSSDFLTGVADLTMEERGQYITLLCMQHQKGHLSEKTIGICVGNASADVLAKFRQDSAGLWYNERLDQVLEENKAFSKAQSEKAKKRWKKHKNNTQANAGASAGAMPYEDEDEDEDRNEIEDKKKGELIEKVNWFMDAFSINSQRELDVGRYFTQIQNLKSLDSFIGQTYFYLKVKDKTGQQRHNWKNYIGSPENNFQDGAWMQNDYKAEFQKLNVNTETRAEKLARL